MFCFYLIQYSHKNGIKSRKRLQNQKDWVPRPQVTLELWMWFPTPHSWPPEVSSHLQKNSYFCLLLFTMFVSFYCGKKGTTLPPSGSCVHRKWSNGQLTFWCIPICFSSHHKLFVAIWGQTPIYRMGLLPVQHNHIRCPLCSIEGPDKTLIFAWRVAECIKISLLKHYLFVVYCGLGSGCPLSCRHYPCGWDQWLGPWKLILLNLAFSPNSANL